MKEATYEYKCRRCGKIFDGVCIGKEFADIRLIDTLKTGVSYCGDIPICKEGFHNDCKDGGVGVGDIIGYRIEGKK